MKLPTATLIKFLVILALRSATEAQAEAAVGLYGPDRYEGIPETCLKPMEFGYCRAKVQRYYFDIRRMKCTMFFWGGCAGNDNNFKSIEECNDFCTHPYENHFQYNNNVEVKEKGKRTEGRGSINAKHNVINSRDSTSSSNISKSVPKFALKPNVTSKETGYKGSFKASSKSFHVIAAPKSSSSSNSNSQPADVIEDEDYDD